MGKSWKRVVDVGTDSMDEGSVTAAFLAWFLGCAFVYSALFGTGFLLYGQGAVSAVCLVVAAVSGFWLFKVLPRIGFSD